jgi:hypothetical protein
VEKSISDYYWKHGFRQCKECLNKKKDKAAIRDWQLQNAYGITTEDYNELLQRQHGRCAICLEDDPKSPDRVKHWYIDHCHTTGKVRGLLCNSCNRGIGLLSDSIENLERAIFYLRDK